MRTLLPLAALLLALDAHADPGPVRVAVVHEGELLPSESKALAVGTRRLGKMGALTVADATAAEIAFAASPSATPPAEWQGAATVIVLHVLPPSGAKGKRVSRGVGDVLIFRPPLVAPVYAERVAGEAAAPLRAETLDKWLTAIAAVAAHAGAAK